MNRASGLEQYSASFWEERYWNVSELVSRMQNRWLRCKQLEELNHTQAARIMELEFYFSCITITGDTVVVDYQKLQRRARRIKASAPPVGLAASRYAGNK